MAEQKPVAEHVIVKWLQYSKRIAIVGLVQWCIVAAISLCYVGISMLLKIQMDDYIVSVIKGAISASSTIAISTSSAYYLHSVADKYIQKTKAITSLESDESSNG